MRILILFWACLLVFTVQGQNWRPFAGGKKYGLLFTDTTNHYSGKSLLITSVNNPRALGNGDTLWQFSKSIGPFGQCRYRTVEGYVPYSPYGNSVLVTKRGLTFYIPAYGSNQASEVYLDFRKPAGTSYTSGSYLISVISKENEIYDRQFQDSIWRATIGGRQVILSKNHGLLRMPCLISTTGSSWSNQYNIRSDMRTAVYPSRRRFYLPDEESIFNYQPGDTLGYENVSRDYLPPYMSYYSYTLAIIRSRYTDSATGRTCYVSSSYRKNGDSYISTGNSSICVDSFPDFISGGRYDYSFYGTFPVIRIGNDSLTGIRNLIGPWRRNSDTCFAPIQDIEKEEVYLPSRGLVFSGGGLSYQHTRQYCYSINGRGIPCGRILFTSLKDNFNHTYSLAQNPFTTELQVQSPTPLHLTLQDLQGKTVAEELNATQLPTRHIPAGMYLLRIQDKQGRVATQRVVKE